MRLPSSRDHEGGRRGRGSWIAIALAVLLLTGAAYGTWWLSGTDLTTEGIERTIASWGAWGVAASLGLMVLHSFLPFPAELVALANGMVYGPFWGTAITWAGAMLGALAAFGLARRLGRPFVRRVIAPRYRRLLDGWTGRRSWQVLLVARLLPIVAFNLVNYAAGLTRIGWWTFAWTTGLGILPGTTLMVALGDRIDRLPWPIWLLLAGACLGLGLKYCQPIDRSAPDAALHENNPRA